MFDQARLFCETFKHLRIEDCYRGLAAIEESRLARLRQAQEYRDGLKQLQAEYAEECRSVIGDKNRKAYEQHRLDQRQSLRTLQTQKPPTREGRDEIEKAIDKMGKEFEEITRGLGIDVDRLDNLRQSHREKRESLYLETIGNGRAAESPAAGTTESDADPEFFPPLLGYSESEPCNLVDDWQRGRTGHIGATITCSVEDCGEDEQETATYSHYWLMAGFAERTGRLVATIDLHPERFQSSMMVADERGYSRVDIRRRLRAFARLESPDITGVTGVKYYWQEGSRNQIVETDRGVEGWGRASYRLPFFYEENGFRLHTFHHAGPIVDGGNTYYTGSPQRGGTWRYQMLLPRTIQTGQLVFATVGIEFLNSVWGNDCTAFSEISFRFLTPRISFDVH